VVRTVVAGATVYEAEAGDAAQEASAAWRSRGPRSLAGRRRRAAGAPPS